MIRSNAHSKGFTLLELLVVLVIMGLMASLIMPEFEKILTSLNASLERDRIQSEITSLSYRAYTLGQSFTLETNRTSTLLPDGQPILDIPQGWSIKARKPIAYHFTGHCTGGILEMHQPGRPVEVITLTPPRCTISD